jgi:hypothetical protein
MPQFPSEFHALAEKFVQQNPDDISQAVEGFYKSICRRKAFIDWRDDLAYQAIRTIVYDHRHASNIRWKNDYGGPAKVTADGDSLGEIASRSFLRTYFINGRPIGFYTKPELQAEGERCFREAEGKVKNGKLCMQLAKKIKGNDKKLLDCINDEDALAVFSAVFGRDAA